MIRSLLFASLAAASVLPSSSALAGPWLLSDFSQGTSSLWNYDEGGGPAFNPRPISGIDGSVIGIDTAPDGTLYAMTTFFDNGLYTVDRRTGAAALIGRTGRLTIEGDIGFDPTTGDLYALYSGNSQPELLRINLSNGVATVVGDFFADDPSGLAFDPDGNLWVMASNANTTRQASLLRIDKANGSLLQTLPTGVDTTVLLGMDFAGDELFVATGGGRLYSVDLTTGAMTERGVTGVTAGGLAYIPEPSTLALLATAAWLAVAPARRSARPGS